MSNPNSSSKKLIVLLAEMQNKKMKKIRIFTGKNHVRSTKNINAARFSVSMS